VSSESSTRGSLIRCGVRLWD